MRKEEEEEERREKEEKKKRACRVCFQLKGEFGFISREVRTNLIIKFV
jgi:hypothetical protein